MGISAHQYLDTFINHEVALGSVDPSQFKLQRVQRLLKKIGDPQENLKIVHVAGSKGKGSVCALTATILQHAGYKTGLYTSPHINNYRERIRILDQKQTPGVCMGDIFPDCISEEELSAVVDEIKPAVEEVRASEDLGRYLSFFEVYTALALYFFKKRNVDIAVLETGLGGRLDATNSVDSKIAVITPVSLEHTRLLGDTVSLIAKEKAAIIKDKGQRVVIAPQEKDACDVIEERCRAFDIVPLKVEDDVRCELAAEDIGGQTLNLKTAKSEYSNIRLPLLGKHQRDNAATSICAAECLRDLGFDIPVDAVIRGCQNVFWPGRFEVVGESPTVILDGAHSPASAKALAQTVGEVLKGRKVILVFGVSGDKDKDAILRELTGISKRTIFTQADHPRAWPLEGAVDVKTALNKARSESADGDIILVTGSIFLTSEARRHLKREEACIK